MKQRFLLSFLLLSLAPTLGLAATCDPTSTKCLGSACSVSELGTTVMDYDKQNIIACLKNTSGAYTWKGMTASGSGTLEIIKAGSFYDGVRYDGMTGTAACAARGKTCAWVESQNFLYEEAVGHDHIADPLQKVASAYNWISPSPNSEAGVEQSGSGKTICAYGVYTGETWCTNFFKDNIHGCSSYLGLMPTYYEAGRMNIWGFFSAVCN
jgi:hypothetical protein